MLDKLQSGLAVLEAASVTPLCLIVRADGEWGFYKTIALGGHPKPGNAKGGFSHPTDINAWRASDWRAFGRIPALPEDVKAATEVGRRIGESLWPGEWSVWTEARESDGALISLTICRRARRETSAAYLVQLRIQNIHPDSIRKLMQGGRP